MPGTSLETLADEDKILICSFETLAVAHTEPVVSLDVSLDTPGAGNRVLVASLKERDMMLLDSLEMLGAIDIGLDTSLETLGTRDIVLATSVETLVDGDMILISSLEMLGTRVLDASFESLAAGDIVLNDSPETLCATTIVLDTLPATLDSETTFVSSSETLDGRDMVSTTLLADDVEIMLACSLATVVAGDMVEPSLETIDDGDMMLLALLDMLGA